MKGIGRLINCAQIFHSFLTVHLPNERRIHKIIRHVLMSVIDEVIDCWLWKKTADQTTLCQPLSNQDKAAGASLKSNQTSGAFASASPAGCLF